MVDQPHYDSFSIPARVCLALAIVGAALFAVVATISWYLLA